MRILALSIFLSLSAPLVAQDFSQIFELQDDALGDLNTYFGSYFEPILGSTANGLTNGWYNTAKPHNFPGFDFTITVNYASIPEELVNFTFNNADYQFLTTSGGDGTALPTFFGGNTNESLNASIPPNTEISIDAPDGLNTLIPIDAIDVRGIPLPMAQIGIGLPKNTELKIRYLPSSFSPIDEFSFSVFGVGVVHDIKQWIPGIKLLPLDISGFAGYTNMEMEFNPDIPNAENEAINLSANALTIQGLVSKKLLFFTPYAGLGVNVVNSSLDIAGTFNGTDANIAVDYVGGGFSPRFTIGGRLKLLIFTIHADYTLQNYSNFTAGLGLSIR